MGKDLFEKWLEEDVDDICLAVTLFGVSGLLERFDQWLWWEGHTVKEENLEEFLISCDDAYINDTVLLFGIRGLLDGFERWLNRVGYLLYSTGHRGPE